MGYIRELNIDLSKRQIITVTGSGGKTTLVENLASELVSEGKNVLIATSTKIFLPGKGNSVVILNEEILRNMKLAKPDVVYGGEYISRENKIVGFKDAVISRVFKNKNIHFILVEGDGSKRMPIKGYGDFEPVVPVETEILISVMGMNSLSTRVNEENVHRLEAFKRITGLKDDEEIGCRDLLSVITHKDGYFKSRGKRNMILLNRVNEKNKSCAQSLREEIYEKLDFVEKVILNKETK